MKKKVSSSFYGTVRKSNQNLPKCYPDVWGLKMKDKDVAVKIRKEFGKQRKEGKLEGRLFMA